MNGQTLLVLESTGETRLVNNDVVDIVRSVDEMDSDTRRLFLLIAAALTCGELSADQLGRMTAAPDARAEYLAWFARIGAARRARVTWAAGTVSNRTAQEASA